MEIDVQAGYMSLSVRRGIARQIWTPQVDNHLSPLAIQCTYFPLIAS